MKEVQSMSDIFGTLGINPKELNSQIAWVKANKKLNPCFRFNVTPDTAFLELYRWYQDCVLDRRVEFQNDFYTQEIVAAVASIMTQNFPGAGLVLCGLPGSGKTTLAKAIVKTCLNLNRHHLFEYMGNDFKFKYRIVTGKMVNNYYQSADWLRILTELSNVPMLVIDDAGLEQATAQNFGNKENAIASLIESRYDSLKFTIITTNMVEEELFNQYGYHSLDRFDEVYTKIVHRAPSYRNRQ